MKVLEYGHIKPMYTLCTGCGATLEFVQRDAKMHKVCLANGPQHDGRDHYINCPVCGKVIFEHSWAKSVEEIFV
jgi:uncharacterized protein with PIN domain